MQNTKRNSIILLTLTGVLAFLTAIAFGNIVMAIIIGIIAIPVYFFIFSFLYVCFGIKTTFNEVSEKTEEAKARAIEMVLERAMWEEEDEKENALKRRKSMRRIKKLQREYPDMWELMVDPDDEYLCFDYINDKKQKKRDRQTFESSIFGASCINDFHHDSGDCHSDSYD